MGICNSVNPNRKSVIKVNENDKKNDNNSGKNDYTNLATSHINEVQYSNNRTNFTDGSPQSKIVFSPKEKKIKTPSNLSSNSTCSQINSTCISQNFILEAVIGETEIPIYVDKNEPIIIKINQNNNNYEDKDNNWSFLVDENSLSFLGHPNFKYKNKNIELYFLEYQALILFII